VSLNGYLLRYIFKNVSLESENNLRSLSVKTEKLRKILWYLSYLLGSVFKSVDKLPNSFIKSLLGVRKQTPFSVAYSEFAKGPLSVICKLIYIKFWVKIIIKNNISPMYRLYIKLIIWSMVHAGPHVCIYC